MRPVIVDAIRRATPPTALFIACIIVVALPCATATGQEITRIPNPPRNLQNLPGDLRQIPVPGPANLSTFVKDRAAAVRLGKALFWDMQVGSDGVQACASCHFRAGADPRSKNQVNPGLNRRPTPDMAFADGSGANYQLRMEDFPFRRLADPADRTSATLHDNNDVVSSQGVHFLGWDPTLSRAPQDPMGFRVGDTNTRRVEPRNTPTVINAVFNHRNFWDGRAENVFNGVNHVGDRDPNARVINAKTPSALRLVRVRLENSSLASQAVAPIVSELEMASTGRTVLDVGQLLARTRREQGRRLSKLRPLTKQRVHPQDSVLGSYSISPLKGLVFASYSEMIKDAFQREWWNSNKYVQAAPDGTVTFVDTLVSPQEGDVYTVMEYNFALFFGLAVQLYEASLVSDDTPWDRFRRQHPLDTDAALNPWTNTAPDHISRLALFGAHLFNDRSRGATNLRCSNCHEENELTDDSVRRIAAATQGPVRNRDGNIIDKGFNNIGVRPTSDDLGTGGADAFGPLSHSRRLFPGDPPAMFDNAAVTKGFGIDGAFKIPSLRNVALTAPYFHNGGALTLRQVLEFYSRGGDLAPITAVDGTPIEPLGVPALTEDEINAVVAFLEALTDERVLYRKAPFDHPQLFVPNGHPGDHLSVSDNGRGLATDTLIEIPETGASGGPPLPGFLEGPFGPQ
jgi:cytochrome c peroxidase